jgi:transcriptional regulator GlxA family with amidase domain
MVRGATNVVSCSPWLHETTLVPPRRVRNARRYAVSSSFLPLDAAVLGCDAAAMNAEILLFDGFDELDAMGPWEVFAGLAAVRDDVSARFVTLEGERDVRADHGAVVRAHGTLSERPDLLLVPGGGWLDRAAEGAWAQAERGEIPAAIAARHAAGSTVASVCTGALLLARAGILDGRRATTNPQALGDLRAAGTIEVLEARVVDDGDILTAGAPACGLDLALHVLERVGGPGLAEAAARELQYERPALAVG